MCVLHKRTVTACARRAGKWLAAQTPSAGRRRFPGGWNPKVISIGRRFSPARKTYEETHMSNRENEGKSGFTLVTLALAALAICAIALMLMPAHATTEVSEETVATYAAAGEVGYLPAQLENEGKEPVQVVDLTY